MLIMECEFVGRQFVICVMEKIPRDMDVIFINTSNVEVRIAVNIELNFIYKLEILMYVQLFKKYRIAL